MKKHKLAGSVAIGVLLGTYFASFLYDFNRDLTFIKYVSPFKYFDPLMMLHESRVEITYVLLSLAVTVVLLAAGFVTYRRRDLYI